MGPQTVSFVERFIIQCPCFGGSTIGGSTVIIYSGMTAINTLDSIV